MDGHEKLSLAKTVCQLSTVGEVGSIKDLYAYLVSHTRSHCDKESRIMQRLCHRAIFTSSHDWLDFPHRYKELLEGGGRYSPQNQNNCSSRIEELRRMVVLDGQFVAMMLGHHPFMLSLRYYSNLNSLLFDVDECISLKANDSSTTLVGIPTTNCGIETSKRDADHPDVNQHYSLRALVLTSSLSLLGMW